MAEGILRKEGEGRFNAFSAGSHPKGKVNPLAIKVLESFTYPTDGYRSKPGMSLPGPARPRMDFVFTVCDSAAGEACPIWPGQPMTAHWGIEDPAAVEGTPVQKEAAFVTAFKYLRNRIAVFTACRFAASARWRWARSCARSVGWKARPPSSKKAG